MRQCRIGDDKGEGSGVVVRVGLFEYVRSRGRDEASMKGQA